MAAGLGQRQSCVVGFPLPPTPSVLGWLPALFPTELGFPGDQWLGLAPYPQPLLATAHARRRAGPSWTLALPALLTKAQ